MANLFTQAASEPPGSECSDQFHSQDTSNWDNTPTGPKMVKPTSPSFLARVRNDTGSGTSSLIRESPSCRKGGFFSYRWHEWRPWRKPKNQTIISSFRKQPRNCSPKSWSDLNKMAVQWKEGLTRVRKKTRLNMSPHKTKMKTIRQTKSQYQPRQIILKHNFAIEDLNQEIKAIQRVKGTYIKNMTQENYDSLKQC